MYLLWSYYHLFISLSITIEVSSQCFCFCPIIMTIKGIWPKKRTEEIKTLQLIVKPALVHALSCGFFSWNIKRVTDSESWRKPAGCRASSSRPKSCSAGPAQSRTTSCRRRRLLTWPQLSPCWSNTRSSGWRWRSRGEGKNCFVRKQSFRKVKFDLWMKS